MPSLNSQMDAESVPPRRSKLRRLILVALLAAGALAGGLAYWLHSRNFVSTDDAFIAGHVADVSARVAGQVVAVLVTDNQDVRQDDVLVRLDPADYQAKADLARAGLATAQKSLEEARAQLMAAKATAQQSASQVVSAQATADNADKEKLRYDKLVTVGAVSREARDNADTAGRVADAALTSAREKFAADQAQVDLAASRIGLATAQVDQAKASLEAASLDLEHTVVYARISGRVTNKDVEPGDYVQAGQSFLSLVDPQVWVVANFKETQITRMRPGQPVTVTVDAFPGRELRGHVDSIQHGTGAAFSLLPPENATGNYVKVVQRVPVKIVLDPIPSEKGMLPAPGLSVVPTVRVR